MLWGRVVPRGPAPGAIVTKSQEASARHEAERKEQEAKGKLERQVIKDKAQAESARKEYLELQAEPTAPRRDLLTSMI